MDNAGAHRQSEQTAPTAQPRMCCAVRVCCGSECAPRGSRAVHRALERARVSGQLPACDLAFLGCTGYCTLGPNVSVNGNIVSHCTPENVVEKVKDACALPHAQGLVSTVDIERFLSDSQL